MRIGFGIIFLLLSWGLQAIAYDDTGGFYRDEVFQTGVTQNCGDLCVSSPNYYEGYLYQQERNTRLFAPQVAKVKEEDAEINALNYRYKGYDYIQGLGWGPDTKVSKMMTRQRVRWSRVARDAGFQVAENDKSLGSALWRELRKPILFDLRDRLTARYKKKKLGLRDKVRVWFLEQTVDAGASSLDLDSFGGGQGQNFNMDFGIKDFIVKFNPRVDPIRGRFGVRLKLRKYLKKEKPLFMAFNANYCNSSTGLGDKTCIYQHELSTSFSFLNKSRKWAYSAYLSYQTDSLDPDAYVVDGEPYEHKPWITGVQVTYSFY